MQGNNDEVAREKGMSKLCEGFCYMGIV